MLQDAGQGATHGGGDGRDVQAEGAGGAEGREACDTGTPGGADRT